MNEINFRNIENYVNNCINNKIFIEEMITDDELKKNVLGPFIGKIENKIVDLKRITVDDIIIFEYKVYNINDYKIDNNILIVKNNNLLLKAIHYENMDYFEDTYCIYIDDSYRLSDRLTVKSYKMDDSEHLNISILGKFVADDSAYFNKKYNLYVSNNEIMAIFSNENIHIKGEYNFDNVLRTFSKLIGGFYNKFNQELDNLFYDGVKEYNIKRKNQEQ